MRKVKDLLKQKNAQVYSITHEITVFNALEQLVEKNIGALLVKEGELIKGIFTERDYARKVVLKGKASKDTQVGEIMNEHPITVNSEDGIDHCMSLMTDKMVRYLIVLDGNELKGLLSIGDLVKFIMEEQKQTIDHLHNYIAGN